MRAAALPLVFLLACRTQGEASCNDNKDNDVDGLLDCGDPDCADAPACRGGETGCSTETWYLDADADGFGNVDRPLEACDAPSGYVADATDCDDLEPRSNPGAHEACDGQDNDCNGVQDDIVVQGTVPMTCVAAGAFLMGSPPEEEGREEDESSHDVTLSQGFEIGTSEVTQEAFEAVRRYNPSEACVDPGYPVESVTWHEAAAFCNEVSVLEGLAPCYTCEGDGEAVECAFLEDPYACEGYRLPTEAEWEFAARAGSTAAFPSGGNLPEGAGTDCETAPVTLDNGTLLDDQAWYCGNTDFTHPVHQRDPNAWGLYDTSGNVWEWVNDAYDDGYYDESPTLDPTGPAETGQRTYRGGSYYTSATGVRTANRSGRTPYTYSTMIGFRLARTALPRPSPRAGNPLPSCPPMR